MEGLITMFLSPICLAWAYSSFRWAVSAESIGNGRICATVFWGAQQTDMPCRPIRRLWVLQYIMVIAFIAIGTVVQGQQNVSLRTSELTAQLAEVAKERKENLRRIKELIASGADATADFVMDENGNAIGLNALQEACIHHHWRVVEYLLDHGAKVNPKVMGGQTHYFSPISCAAGHSLRLTKRMVRLGADVNSDLDDKCSTPLMSAVYNRRIDVINYLISRHVRINAVARDHTTALDQAQFIVDWRARLKIVRLLRNCGARTWDELKRRYPNKLPDDFEWPPPRLPR